MSSPTKIWFSCSFSALIIIFSFVNSGQCEFTPEELQYIRESIHNEFIPSNNIPGVGFAVFRDGDSFADGFGFKNLENLVVATSRTNFAVASVTKSLTATVVVKTLNDKFPSMGVSVLNEPIANLLPGDFNFTLSDRYRSESVTFRDLLSHRTCLSTNVMGRTFGAIKDSQEFAYRARYVKEICPFRTAYNYNNGAYGWIGELIGAIGGAPFSQLAKNLLEEIGMNDTLVISETLEFDNMEHMSRAYYRRDGAPRRFNSELLKRMTLTLPSGGMLPSPRDMVTYLNFHLNYGKVGNKQIVPANMMRQLHRPSFHLSFSIEDTSDPAHMINSDYAYGLGLRLGVYDNWAISSHEGTTPPFRSRMSLYPALKIGIFTVTNGPGTLYGVSHQELHEKIFNKLMGKNDTSLAEKTEKSTVTTHRRIKTKHKKKHNSPIGFSKLNQHQADFLEWAGLYGHPVYGELQINYNESDPIPLYLQYGRWGTGPLRNISDTEAVFVVEWDSDIIGDFLSANPELPEMRLTFLSNEENVKVVQAEFEGEASIFVKDATVDKYPSQIWNPSSCGPSYTMTK